MQLARADAWLLEPYLRHHGLHNGVACSTVHLCMQALVVRLTTDPEQPTGLTNRHALRFLRDLGCPGNGFFAMLIPCSLASTSSAVLYR